MRHFFKCGDKGSLTNSSGTGLRPARRVLPGVLAAAVLLGVAGCAMPFKGKGAVKSVASSRAVFHASSSRVSSQSSSSLSSDASGASSWSTASALSQTGSAVLPETVPVSGKIAYLTFDDGPTSYTPRFLAVLKQYNVKGTFFIAFMGEDSSIKRAWLRQEVADGNAIGVHSWTHDYQYIYSSEQNFLTDFNTMRRVIHDVTGLDPHICRFPGGIGNTVSLKYHHRVPIMPTLIDDVERMGFKPFDWSAGGEDAQYPLPVSGTAYANEIMNEIGSEQHPIILMHDRTNVTLAALPIVIERLKAKGYSFGTLDTTSPTVMEKPAGVSHYSSSQSTASSKAHAVSSQPKPSSSQKASSVASAVSSKK